MPLLYCEIYSSTAYTGLTVSLLSSVYTSFTFSWGSHLLSVSLPLPRVKDSLRTVTIFSSPDHHSKNITLYHMRPKSIFTFTKMFLNTLRHSSSPLTLLTITYRERKIQFLKYDYIDHPEILGESV